MSTEKFSIRPRIERSRAMKPIYYYMYWFFNSPYLARYQSSLPFRKITEKRIFLSWLTRKIYEVFSKKKKQTFTSQKIKNRPNIFMEAPVMWCLASEEINPVTRGQSLGEAVCIFTSRWYTCEWYESNNSLSSYGNRSRGKKLWIQTF